jgi:hypothetical protein
MGASLYTFRAHSMMKRFVFIDSDMCLVLKSKKQKRKLFDFNRMIVVPYILKKTDFGQHVFHVDPRAISSIVVV